MLYQGSYSRARPIGNARDNVFGDRTQNYFKRWSGSPYPTPVVTSPGGGLTSPNRAFLRGERPSPITIPISTLTRRHGAADQAATPRGAKDSTGGAAEGNGTATAGFNRSTSGFGPEKFFIALASSVFDKPAGFAAPLVWCEDVSLALGSVDGSILACIHTKGIPYGAPFFGLLPIHGDHGQEPAI